jgi:hypothetical protein
MTVESPARLKKLQEYLQAEHNINWEQYLKRFEGTKPIELWTTNYPFRLQPELIESEIELLGKLSSKRFPKKFERQYKITVGFKKKIRKEEVKGLPYLRANITGLDHLIRQDIIDQMLQICPNDFEAVPVKIIGTDRNSEAFELGVYYTINVLKRIKAIDELRSEFYISENGIAHINKFRYKENPWQDGFDIGVNVGTSEEMYPSCKLDTSCMIAKDALSGAIVWHPELAKLFPFDALYWFIQDCEQDSLY